MNSAHRAAAVFGCLFLVIMVLLVLAAAQRSVVLDVGGKNYTITKIADSEQAREQGLMNMVIDNNTLMLFVFPVQGIYPFWMKDTTSNLDIIWINITGRKGNVVFLADNATAESMDIITPGKPADYVLEAQAGFIERNNITTGSPVTLA